MKPISNPGNFISYKHNLPLIAGGIKNKTKQARKQTNKKNPLSYIIYRWGRENGKNVFADIPSHNPKSH